MYNSIINQPQEVNTEYILKQYDIPLLRFTAELDAADPNYAVTWLTTALGEPYMDALRDMFLLDAIICNTDRHFGNFGFLIDNCTNRIVAPAPLFDHGNSLFNLAGKGTWESDVALNEYAETLVPCVYDDFVTEAKSVLSADKRERLRGMLGFRFTRHGRYHLPKDRLERVEKQVQKRVRLILG